MKYVKKTMHMGAKSSTFKNAEYLRDHPTAAEEILWPKLNKNQIEGIHFRRQHPFSRYVPDFYAHSIKLVIELDGSIHEKRDVKFTDADREANLKLHRLYILRYKNQEVYDNLDDVVEDIRNCVIELIRMKENK